MNLKHQKATTAPTAPTDDTTDTGLAQVDELLARAEADQAASDDQDSEN
ncbi:hypothetical protein OP752_05760 [Latilactobacillus curvatus]|nr:hypothetical protein [Latilactobacillus curvatus]